VNALKGPFSDPDGAVEEFEKKFKDKTRNEWNNRSNFKTVAGKYTLLETDDDEDDEDEDEEDYEKMVEKVENTKST